MAIYTSDQLGWNPASANINAQLANFLSNIAKAGDTLHLNGKVSGVYTPFRVSSRNNTFPTNFTITAETGCGVDFIGTVTSAGGPCFKASGSITLDNVLFTASEAPETNYQGNNPVADVDHHRPELWYMTSSGAKTIRSCTFRHNIGSFMRLGGSGVVDIRNTAFHRCKYQIYISGAIHGLYVKNCLFDDGLIDGIKVIVSGGGPCTNWLIEDTIFQNSRDGIDITGGLLDSTINRCKFRYLNVTGFDAKFAIQPGETSTIWDTKIIDNVTFNDCHFVDLDSACCVTYNNDTTIPTTYAMQETYIPKNITMNNCEFERTVESAAVNSVNRIWLWKPGHHERALNCIKRGWTNQNKESQIVINFSGAGGWVSHDNLVTTASVIAARRPRDYSIPFVVGQGGVVSEDPGIPAAPTSAGAAIAVNAATGDLTIDPARLPALSAKAFTARVTTGYGTASDTFAVTNTLS